MRTPLAWMSLIHTKRRSLVVVGGVCLVLVLIFLQLGFYGTLHANAVLIYDHLRFDLLLVSAEYVFLDQSGGFPRDRLAQARAVAGVARVMPLYLEQTLWRNRQSRRRVRMRVVAFDLRDRPFLLPELENQVDALRQVDTVLIDRGSRPESGLQEIGVETEIRNHRVRIGGQVALGVGFAAEGSLLVSDQNFARLLEHTTLDNVSLGLVELQPGTDVEGTAHALRAVLPAGVQVLTRPDIERLEMRYWVERTPAGLMFGLGVVVAFTVGSVILYQVLASDVTRNRREYATLKALGFYDRSLAWVVLQKAGLMAGLAYVPAVVLTVILYGLTSRATGLPLQLGASRAAFVFFLALLMCSGAGLFALRKIRTADPANLF